MVIQEKMSHHWENLLLRDRDASTCSETLNAKLRKFRRQFLRWNSFWISRLISIDNIFGQLWSIRFLMTYKKPEDIFWKGVLKIRTWRFYLDRNNTISILGRRWFEYWQKVTEWFFLSKLSVLFPRVKRNVSTRPKKKFFFWRKCDWGNSYRFFEENSFELEMSKVCALYRGSNNRSLIKRNNEITLNRFLAKGNLSSETLKEWKQLVILQQSPFEAQKNR